MLCDVKNGMKNIEIYSQQVSSILSEGGNFFVISHNSPEHQDGDDDDDDGDEEEVAEWLKRIISGLTTPAISTPSTNKKRKLPDTSASLTGNGNRSSNWTLDIHMSSDSSVHTPNVYIFTKLRQSNRKKKGKGDSNSDETSRGDLLQIQVHEH